jgi:hypothetical protein
VVEANEGAMWYAGYAIEEASCNWESSSEGWDDMSFLEKDVASRNPMPLSLLCSMIVDEDEDRLSSILCISKDDEDEAEEDEEKGIASEDANGPAEPFVINVLLLLILLLLLLLLLLLFEEEDDDDVDWVALVETFKAEELPVMRSSFKIKSSTSMSKCRGFTN